MLYKFLGDIAEHDRDFETLKCEKFFASSFESLNDPWDAPKNFIDRDSIKNLPNSQSRKLATELLTKIDAFGIYCLSTENTSPLMWAHYASNWRGLCIEYDYDGKEFFEELRKTYSKDVFISALPMKYLPTTTHINAIDLATTAPLLIARYLFGQKKIDWGYEKEFRLIFNKSGLFHMPSLMISKVYLGYAMRPEQKNKYLKLFSGKGIPVFEAHPNITSNNSTVSLNFKPFDSTTP